MLKLWQNFVGQMSGMKSGTINVQNMPFPLVGVWPTYPMMAEPHVHQPGGS